MQAWDDFLSAQEKRLGKATIDKWLRPLKTVHFDSGNLYLEAEGAFQLHWFEEHIRPRLAMQLVNNNHRPIKVHISLKEAQAGTKKGKGEPRKEPLVFFSDTLDKAATFESFIPPQDSLVSYRLLSELATSPSPEAPNPLFLWGETGTGKTHLLMALTQAFQKRGLKARYCRTETFTQHVVAAIRNSEMAQLRSTYRAADVLLIDDVHQLARKDATQEEFFHTFNTLHTTRRQLILTSALPPALLTDIEPRLISRFEWGITLHIGKLDSEELATLLDNRCRALEFSLPPEVCAFLVETFPHCTRLKCALEALILRSHLQPCPSLGIQETQALLCDLIAKEREIKLTPEKIINAAATHFGIRADLLASKTQTQECVWPRQLAMYLCRKELKLSYNALGRLFTRDHSTVMASVKQVEQKISDHDGETLTALFTIQKRLQSLVEQRGNGCIV